MCNDIHNCIGNRTIGIIGCGHLGMALAMTLAKKGLPKEKIRLSYSGSASTYERIKKADMLECISTNEEICETSSVVFIMVRPQAFASLRQLSFRKDALVVSGMAGISSDFLEKSLGIHVFRMMTSGPDTITEQKGIAAVYPYSENLSGIISGIGLRTFQIQNEEAMHYFTVGVCLPAALMAARKMSIGLEDAIDTLEKDYPEFKAIYKWAKNVMPDSISEEEQETYIRLMSTEGGITQKIVRSLYSGSTLLESLRNGIARSKEIQMSLQTD